VTLSEKKSEANLQSRRRKGEKKVNGNKQRMWGRQDGAQHWNRQLGAVEWWRPGVRK